MSKPIPAIVEPAQIDVAQLEAQLVVAIREHNQAQRSIGILEGELQTARGAAKMRRIEIGTLLNKIRGAWPQRGPKAKGYGEMLARLKLDDATAHRYAEEARDPEGFAQRQAKPLAPRDGDRDDDEDDHGQYRPKLDGPIGPGSPAPFRQLDADELVQALARLPADERRRVLGKANVHGASGEKRRGAYCTPKKYAIAAGPWDLDPFTNPRSHVVAAARCMLEDGGDGFGDRSQAGVYRTGEGVELGIATETTRVWIQPDYRFVLEAIEHYGHTRFCALLRFAPDTEWFERLWPRVAVVAIPFGERIAFEIEGQTEDDSEGAPFPHAFFFADERDLTDELRAMCLVWHLTSGTTPTPTT